MNYRAEGDLAQNSGLPLLVLLEEVGWPQNWMRDAPMSPPTVSWQTPMNQQVLSLPLLCTKDIFIVICWKLKAILL